MDRLERYDDPTELFLSAFEAQQTRIWTMLPGVVQAVTNNGQTLEVQPAINGRVRQKDGTYKPIQMPKIVDVIVQWIGGGGATWTFPIKAGDECSVFFSSRCIDSWWQLGFSQPSGQIGADGNPVNIANNPPEFRMHNLSDGFALVGLRNSSRALTGLANATTARLRTDDNSCYLEFDPVGKKLNAVFPNGINLNGLTIDSGGNLATTGNITGSTVTGTTQTVSGSGGTAVHGTTHTHPSNNQPPTPGT
jgi:hypothetical protein